jgi:hypothetical protein
MSFCHLKFLKFLNYKTAFYARVREGRSRRRFLILKSRRGEKRYRSQFGGTVGLMDLPRLMDNVPLPTRRLDNAARCPQLHKPPTAAKRFLIGF